MPQYKGLLAGPTGREHGTQFPVALSTWFIPRHLVHIPVKSSHEEQEGVPGHGRQTSLSGADM